MPYLLDGNNLIGLFRKTARPDASDRQALVAELAERLRRTRARAILFFDGPAGGRGSSMGALSIRPAPGGSADDAIVREVERARTPAEMTVVTADRGLARRARHAGAAVCAPEEFFARFGKDQPALASKPSAGPVDVEGWMKYFQDEGNRGGGRTK
jgi:YacP-like NYN domain-containing protein